MMVVIHNMGYNFDHMAIHHLRFIVDLHELFSGLVLTCLSSWGLTVEFLEYVNIVSEEMVPECYITLIYEITKKNNFGDFSNQF